MESNIFKFIHICSIICAIFGLQVVSFSIKNDNVKICKSKTCKKIADEIISGMNQTMNPCESFFKYACGNWDSEMSHKSHFHLLTNRTNFRLKEIFESPWTPQDSSALTKAKKVYKVCMNEDSIEKRGVRDLVNLVDDISGWPMAMTSFEWTYKKKSWQEIDRSFRKIIGNSPLFGLKVMADFKNSTNHIITLSPPVDGIAEYITPLAATSLTLDDILNLPNVIKYRSIVANISRIFASDRGVSIEEKDIEEDSKDIVAFEWNLKLLSVSFTNSSKQEVDNIYQKMMISDFQKFYESTLPKNSATIINWYDLIASLFNELPDVNIRQSEIIAVIDKNYFVKLADLIKRTPVRVVVNTMHWWLIRNFGSFTNKLMNSLIKNILPGGLSTVVNKNDELNPRWLICTLQNQMMHAFSYAYVKKYFPKRSQDAAVELIHEIINGMREEIKNSKWLDEYSKSGALEKVQAMKEFIGFPHWYKDINSVDNYYKNVVPTKFYFQNILMMLKFNRKESFKLLRERVSNQKWIGRPVDVNAFYYYPANAITIPAGILQIPFFEDEHPDALNYGGIGSIIGHEISHGFDDLGRQFDKSGNVRNWWSNATMSEYRKRAQCFIDKFNKYTIVHNNTTHRVNSQKTLSENIADSTGVKAVFEAFKVHNKKSLTSDIKLPGLEHLSSYKLFFLSYAHSFCANLPLNLLINQIKNDDHSPARFRIEGTLSNIQGFADTFNCPVGTKMNPINKCSIW